MIDFNTYMDNFHKTVSMYAPKKNEQPELYESLCKPNDPYRIPLDIAEKMQLKTIKSAFLQHYNNNPFYHNFCKEQNFVITGQKIHRKEEYTPR